MNTSDHRVTSKSRATRDDGDVVEDEVLEVEPADIISRLIVEFFCFALVRALQIII